MNKKIFLPYWLWVGVKPLKNSFPKRYKLIVFDTETESATTGKPYLLVFYDGEKPKYVKVKPETIADEFFSYLISRCPQRCSNILFAHNLPFDLTAVLTSKEIEAFVWQKPPTLIHPFGKITVYPQKTWFAQIELKNGAYVKVVDSANFIKGSLFNLSRILNLEHKKRQRPDFVKEGRKPKNETEWRELLRYCCDEIKAEYDLAKFILSMHREYNVGFCVSIPGLAAKVFRKHFLKKVIPQVAPWIRKLVELSIHGGRTSCFTPAPVVIPNVKMYDYNSFYPWAMANLPPLTEGKWLRVNDFVDEHEGFYLIYGFVRKCKYPIILKHAWDFKFANGERIRKVPISSYELREALRAKEFEPEKITGYIWIPSKDAVNPFRDYVDEFYKAKSETSKEDPLYLTNKILLNSLYGKTCQALRLTDYEEEPDWVWNERSRRCVKTFISHRAGGLYLPHVGGWTTAMCRAKLHEDLHKHEAIDCATDSFKTFDEIKPGKGLGELKQVAKGLLLMVRPKMYIMFSDEVQNEVLEVGDLRRYLDKNLGFLEIGKDIMKCAQHGFQGSPFDLLKLYRDKSNEYPTKHMTKIKESIRQRKQPRVMETQKRKLKINWENEVGLCGLKKKDAIKEKELCCLNCFNCAYFKTIP